MLFALARKKARRVRNIEVGGDGNANEQRADGFSAFKCISGRILSWVVCLLFNDAGWWRTAGTYMPGFHVRHAHGPCAADDFLRHPPPPLIVTITPSELEENLSADLMLTVVPIVKTTHPLVITLPCYHTPINGASDLYTGPSSPNTEDNTPPVTVVCAGFLSAKHMG